MPKHTAAVTKLLRCHKDALAPCMQQSDLLQPLVPIGKACPRWDPSNKRGAGTRGANRDGRGVRSQEDAQKRQASPSSPPKTSWRPGRCNGLPQVVCSLGVQVVSKIEINTSNPGVLEHLDYFNHADPPIY